VVRPQSGLHSLVNHPRKVLSGWDFPPVCELRYVQVQIAVIEAFSNFALSYLVQYNEVDAKSGGRVISTANGNMPYVAVPVEVGVRAGAEHCGIAGGVPFGTAVSMSGGERYTPREVGNRHASKMPGSTGRRKASCAASTSVTEPKWPSVRR